MFTHHRTEAVFLKKTDQGEANQIFTVYAKDFGKLEVFAKTIRNIKSKLKASADVFYLSEIEFVQGRNHKILTDASRLESFFDIRKDLLKLQIAYKIGQAIDGLLIGEERDEEIWSLITETFKKLSMSEFNAEIVYQYFLWNFFSVLGYQPQVWQCVACHQKLIPRNIYFSPEKGGVFCGQCRENNLGEKISPETVKFLRIIFKKNWFVLGRLRVSSQEKNSLNTVSEKYFAHILACKIL